MYTTKYECLFYVLSPIIYIFFRNIVVITNLYIFIVFKNYIQIVKCNTVHSNTPGWGY